MNLKVKNGVTTMSLHATEKRTIKASRQLLALMKTHGEPKWKDLARVLDVGMEDIEKAFCDKPLIPEPKVDSDVPAHGVN